MAYPCDLFIFYINPFLLSLAHLYFVFLFWFRFHIKILKKNNIMFGISIIKKKKRNNPKISEIFDKRNKGHKQTMRQITRRFLELWRFHIKDPKWKEAHERRNRRRVVHSSWFLYLSSRTFPFRSLIQFHFFCFLFFLYLSLLRS